MGGDASRDSDLRSRGRGARERGQGETRDGVGSSETRRAMTQGNPFKIAAAASFWTYITYGTGNKLTQPSSKPALPLDT